MAKSIFKNVSIKGVSIVLGEEKKVFANEPEYYNNDEEQLAKLKKMIGFDTRYWSKSETTTADLCRQAAKNLLEKLNIDKNTVDAIISVTQTPDYYMPGNAHVVHRDLGFPKETAAFDMEFGCSGYVYGLWTAFMMINSGLKRVLLLTGDTLSKSANKKDRTEAPLFGDSGSATVIEYDENAGDSYFMLKSDGNGIESMLQPAGAYRTPSTDETRKEICCCDNFCGLISLSFLGAFASIFSFKTSERKRPKSLFILWSTIFFCSGVKFILSNPLILCAIQFRY